MKKSILYLLMLVSTLLMAKPGLHPSKRERHHSLNKPNIVIIMADDLDSRQLSCYGGKNIKTPNIDGLAAAGLQFNHIYASEAMCIPIRASLFTGLYPMHHGSYQNHKPVYNDRNLQSVCQYLGNLGYRVGLTGKNHSTTPRTVFPFQIIKGFEPSCISPTDDYFLDSVRNFVAKKDKPYCLFVMSINPHAPWTMGDPSEFNPDKLVLPAHWVDTKESRHMFCKYLAEVRRLDNQVGEVVAMLKQTGQDKNTVIMFLGEQGPQFPGGKWSLYDYGQKSSMIVRYDGKIKPKSQTNAIVQYEDILPTLIELSGGNKVPGMDGQSFLRVLYGKTDRHREYAYGIHNNIPEGQAYPIRSVQDSKYKLILNLIAPEKYTNKFLFAHNPNSIWQSWLDKAANNTNDQFLIDRIMHRPPVEFYNIQKDPDELNNLADKPGYKALVDKYTALVHQWMTEQGDPGAEIDKSFGKVVANDN